MNENKLPQPGSDEYDNYFEDKYGEENAEVAASKSNRKDNQESERNFMPMDGKFTREFSRIRHERDQRNPKNK